MRTHKKTSRQLKVSDVIMGMGKDVILPKFNYVNERLVSVSAPINDVIKILLCFSLRAFSRLKISKAQEYNLRINIREIKTNEIKTNRISDRPRIES